MTSDPLSREQIVRVAVELLDAEGVDGLSMRRLAGRIGAGATSLYWYVRSKEELVALAADAVFGEVGLPDPGREGWRAAAGTMARGLRATVLRHPWLPLVAASQPVVGPATARYTDHAFAVFRAAGFTGADLVRASNALVALVYGTTLSEATTNQGAPPREEPPDPAGETAIPSPRLRDRSDGAARDPSFEFGLRTVLDGLEARLTGPAADADRP
ncbi:TetR/AcrR family transcriptional regulator [Amycolatopsis samaneae]|uniref:TetR/AcrR family transcriptional regulator n=1 Tax=Amycolatopsis samaneae TaxID=664691 RepID=A0ABW5G7M5_9PSEU